MQQEAIVHIVSILNITRYAAQVNRQHINIAMDRFDEMVHDVNNLYNITTSLATSLSYYQLVLHIRSVLATFMIHYTVCNSFQSIKCLLWISLMKISQQDIMSLPNIL